MAKKAANKTRPAPATDAPTAIIQLRLVDGTRAALSPSRKYLVRILDGQQTELLVDTFAGPEQPFKVPFHDNLADRYAVLVSAKNCADTGFFPVVAKRDTPVIVNLMLVQKPPNFDFSQADWDLVQRNWPKAYGPLAYGVPVEAARQRYDALLQTPPRAAALWNILTAMRDTQLSQGTALDYLREIIWDGELAPAQDRFFAFAHIGLVDQMVQAASQGTFAPEPHPNLFHKDATRSFKQVAFGEANLQLTLHEGVTKPVGTETWVRIEPDIDCYKDLAAHTLLEVLPNQVTGAKTDPVTAYVLRWVAGQQAGVPEFDPPYCV